MGDLDNDFLSAFYKADDYEVGSVLELTITGIERFEFTDEKTGESTPKVAVTVAESKQKMKLGNTSGRLLKKLFGTESKAWVGKRVKFIVLMSGVGAYFSAVEPKPNIAKF